ncbi:MAG: iron-sulfur cluster assembly scaffold protein [Novosphingobium sp.]|nr:iron-sulfur cluster assembly scaffold protein [Novosphingobium sp.]
MSGAARLYTPELLGLAVRLADYPHDPGLPLHGEARSASCGSTLALDLALDAGGRIERLGMKVHACAVGQAAAALFADAAAGRTADDIVRTETAIAIWLAGEGELPDWPGLATIEPARAFPGRHGAIMLPWRAAAQALSKAGTSR